MELCTVTKITAATTNKEHFAIVHVGDTNWPVALMGPATGSNVKENEAEAKFFADAPVMHGVLETLATEFKGLTPEQSLSKHQISTLSAIVDRAERLIKKHQGF